MLGPVDPQVRAWAPDMLVQYQYQQDTQVSRGLPFAPAGLASGMLKHYTLSDFVAYILTPLPSGQPVRVVCCQMKATVVGGDMFRLDSALEPEIANHNRAQADANAASADPEGGSDDEWLADLAANHSSDRNKPGSEAKDPPTEELLAIVPMGGPEVAEIFDALPAPGDVVFSDSEDGAGDCVAGAGADNVGEAPLASDDPPGEGVAQAAAAVPPPPEPISLARCYEQCAALPTPAAVAARCGFYIRPRDWSLRRVSDDFETGRCQVTFEGRTLQGACKSHKGCKLLVNANRGLDTAEHALVRWLIAGTELSRDQHQEIAKIVKGEFRIKK